MSRPDLQPPECSDAAKRKMAQFHSDVLDEVRQAVSEHAIVVVGMGGNPHVKRARKLLDAAEKPHHFLCYGSYVGGWKPRLAIKMWSGWPTFPQVFVDGTLIGGAAELDAFLKDGQVSD